ncbi:uncharacterized protein LOC142587949 isoform X5 [Dermacentor variabilis]|uniref:uncharacterized protein LOC142587949 isoform X5 n=1 Tax=Dermacentor variabilis TaxID=34621 RepID=UPI003F5B693A
MQRVEGCIVRYHGNRTCATNVRWFLVKYVSVPNNRFCRTCCLRVRAHLVQKKGFKQFHYKPATMLDAPKKRHTAYDYPSSAPASRCFRHGTTIVIKGSAKDSTTPSVASAPKSSPRKRCVLSRACGATAVTGSQAVAAQQMTMVSRLDKSAWRDVVMKNSGRAAYRVKKGHGICNYIQDP